MPMKKFLILLMSLLICSSALAQLVKPKYEMRGVWVASLGIDWPSRTGVSDSDIRAQKSELIDLLKKYKSYGLNTVFFHIRPECDAVYKSPYEPWSKFLTGRQGKAPEDPNYDPLQFAIEEAHKLGLELHAWMNPYRALRSDESVSSLSSAHVINTHPEWIIKCASSQYRFLDPGLPKVREYVTKIVMDVVRRYEVDGIHFDDYFYPYRSYGSFNDDASFNKYKNGFTNRTKWRENNVNLLLATLDDSIKSVKPFIKYGISPSGNQGVNLDIYCRTSDWLDGNYVDDNGQKHSGTPYIDYILPQLYWVNYYGRLPDWSSESFLNGCHLYIGHAAYRFEDGGWPVDELSRQIKKNRTTSTVDGSVYFSSKSLTRNLAHCTDTMKNNYYKYPALLPKMAWKEQEAPAMVGNFRYAQFPTTGNASLQWDVPANAAKEGEFLKYIVYRFDKENVTASDLEDVANIEDIIDVPYYLPEFSTEKGNYYVLTAVDANSNESQMSGVVQILPPGSCAPVSPANNAVNQPDSVVLRWSYAENASSYQIQIASDEAFANIIVDQSEIADSAYQFTGVLGQEKYFWKVKPFNGAGEGEFSEVATFTTGFPKTSTLVAPEWRELDVPIRPTFFWNKAETAVSYRMQMGYTDPVRPAEAIFDTTGITDTTFTYKTDLEGKKIYYWRIQGINQYGESVWSESWGFRTEIVSDVEEETSVPTQYNLAQNYPNPFNPSTNIKFSVPELSNVRLEIFNILGEKVRTLINGQSYNPGNFNIVWNGRNDNGDMVPTGIYLYKMQTGKFNSVKKMLLIK